MGTISFVESSSNEQQGGLWSNLGEPTHLHQSLFHFKSNVLQYKATIMKNMSKCLWTALHYFTLDICMYAKKNVLSLSPRLSLSLLL